MKRQSVTAGLLALLVLAPVAGSAATVASGFGQERVDPDGVVLDVALLADGDARWTVEYRVRLATDNETAAFEDLAADVRENDSLYERRFRDRMARTAAGAENATGREMAVENVTVTAEQRALPQSYGVVTYRFRWTNFAVVDGDRVRAGDALAGLFLDEETSLRVAWPAGYEPATVAPAADETGGNVAVWRGPREFGPNEPTVVVAPGASGPASGGLASVPVLAGAALLVAVVLVGAVLVLTGRFPTRGGPFGAAETDGDSDERDDADGPPSELLSNEERVLKLLEAEDGRMKQQQVAERLDWTAAKTSQVVGDMREEGTVETFRLGRENVVTLPDRGLGEDLGPGSE